MIPNQEQQLGLHENASHLNRLFALAEERTSAIERSSGGTKHDHATRMIEILEEDDLYTPSTANRLAIAIHDLVVEGKRNSEGQNHQFIAEYLSILNSRDCPEIQQRVGLYALGIALRKHELESQLEDWRARFTFDRETSSPMSDQDYQFYKDVVRESIARRQTEPVDDDTVRQTMHEISSALFYGGAPVSENMKKVRIPIDLQQLIYIANNNDIDTIRLAAAELLDNLRYPNIDRPSSTWRDAMESLQLSAVLQIIGDNELASRLRSRAYLYLNAESPMYEKVGLIKEISEEILSREGERLNELSNESYLRVYNATVGRMPSRPPAFKSRSKGRGAILEKMATKQEEAQAGTSSDAVGTMTIIEDLPEDVNKPLFMFNYAIDLAKSLHKSNINLRLGHTRPNEHSVEISYGTSADVALALEQISQMQGINAIRYEDNGKAVIEVHIAKRGEADGVFHVVLGPARQAKFAPESEVGYQGVHINTVHNRAIVRPGVKNLKVGAEIRLLDEQAFYNNKLGYAAEPFYRADSSMGKLGEALRSGNTYLAQSIIDQCLREMENIHNRAQILKEGRQLWLHPNTLNQLSVLSNELPDLTALIRKYYHLMYPNNHEDLFPHRELWDRYT